MTTPYDLPEWSCFMTAIRANLADDVPRLIAADWLEEHGEAKRAEFIRWQVECPKSSGGFGPTPPAGRIYDRHLVGVSNEWTLYKRGFISEVRCTLADWVGGECLVHDNIQLLIEGEPIESAWLSAGSCSRCQGTGRTPAHGPAIACMGALERVVLTDRKPWNATGLLSGYAARECWRWILNPKGSDISASDRIDYQIYYYMIPLADRESLTYLEFPTEEAAMDALSEACIGWAFGQLVEVKA